MDMTLTAEVLDPGDDKWTVGDSYHVFSTEEAIYPAGLFLRSFYPSLLGLNAMLVMAGDLNIATQTQCAKSLEKIAICGSSEDDLLQPSWWRHQLCAECN